MFDGVRSRDEAESSWEICFAVFGENILLDSGFLWMLSDVGASCELGIET